MLYPMAWLMIPWVKVIPNRFAFQLVGTAVRAHVVNTTEPVLEFGFHSILIEWQRMLSMQMA